MWNGWVCDRIRPQHSNSYSRHKEQYVTENKPMIWLPAPRSEWPLIDSRPDKADRRENEREAEGRDDDCLECPLQKPQRGIDGFHSVARMHPLVLVSRQNYVIANAKVPNVLSPTPSKIIFSRSGTGALGGSDIWRSDLDFVPELAKLFGQILCTVHEQPWFRLGALLDVAHSFVEDLPDDSA